MKKYIRCFLVILILCLSISPVEARAGGGSSGSSSSSGGSSSSGHAHPYHHAQTPIERFSGFIGFSLIAGGVAGFVIYSKRSKAIRMHKEIKTQLKQKEDPFWNEKRINQDVIDSYYVIEKAWGDKDMKTLQTYLTPSLYEQWETKLNWWEYEGMRNEISHITLLKTMIVKIEEGAFWSYIEGKMTDKMIKNGEIIQSDSHVFVEYWRFVIKAGHIYLDEIKQEDEV